MHHPLTYPLAAVLGMAVLLRPVPAVDSMIYDIAQQTENDGTFTRIYGAEGDGRLGVPVMGAADCDGDGFQDYGISFIMASPLERAQAGIVALVFGDGSFGPFRDTAVMRADILQIAGVNTTENAGTEITMADVTGDGLGDLLIGRQNYTHASEARVGAGALTVIVGSPALRAHAATLQMLDLAVPHPQIVRVDFVGAANYDRLGIWTRAGDVTGDGIDDMLVGADQIDGTGESNRGAVYLIRGGPHLAVSRTVDLAQFGATELEGNLARFDPPAGPTRYHFGSTCQIADLDGNGRGEVLASAALNRASAGLRPPGVSAASGHYQATGGTSNGSVFIAWDDNFSADPWPDGFQFAHGEGPGSFTAIHGGADSDKFGEELAGNGDFNGDRQPDLFVGDITGDGSPTGNRSTSGMGHVFYGTAAMRGEEFGIDQLAPGVSMTTILGPVRTAIGGDTAGVGDFDADGLDDLLFGSPHDAPQGRLSAGSVIVFYGQLGGWPALIDTAPETFPDYDASRYAYVQGAKGGVPGDSGDTLCYSADVGDIDGDGRSDIIVNEMEGNGLAPGSEDVGNLLVISGAALLDAPENAVAEWMGYSDEPLENECCPMPVRSYR